MSTLNQLVAVRDEGECARLAERFQSAYPFPHVGIDGFFRPGFIARPSRTSPLRERRNTAASAPA